MSPKSILLNLDGASEKCGPAPGTTPYGEKCQDECRFGYLVENIFLKGETSWKKHCLKVEKRGY